MIGTSLSYRSLVHDREGELAPDVLLPKLWAAGVRGVELRAVWGDTDPHEVLSVANLLWDYGFLVTVHGGCETVENAVEKAPNIRMGIILRMRYIDGAAWEKVAECVPGVRGEATEDGVRKMAERYLDSLKK
jgi:FAD/FMN-containing dehydrogenase